MSAAKSVLTNMFLESSRPGPRFETAHRQIVTDLPTPNAVDALKSASELFPRVNCYQPPVVWDRAVGYQVFDSNGNCWIDLSSGAVMANSGHGHDAIRAALRDHLDGGLLAQFSFHSEVRVRLAKRLIEVAPAGFEKVYFWTTGSEAIESAFRIAREWGRQKNPEKVHVLTHVGDYHGCTLGAHQLSGSSASKPWLAGPDPGIHHIPFPHHPSQGQAATSKHWESFFDASIDELNNRGIAATNIAAVFIETIQGWGAITLPIPYLQRLRRWANANDVLVIFDEVQTGFGRTGAWFGHEHYGIDADMICVGKGLTSGLPLAAVLGRADVLDVFAPGEITTTHAAHPLSCIAALANLEVIEHERLVHEAARKGRLLEAQLRELANRFPNHIGRTCGIGLLQAIHLQNPDSHEPDPQLARDLTWEAVRHGVMLFFTNQSTLKVCPPLMIPDDAMAEGVEAIGQALESLVQSNKT